MGNVGNNYLGIDWGTSKVGVALAHQETGVALAYGIFPNNETLMDELGNLVLKEEVGAVIIGVPEHDKSQVGQEKARDFGRLLSERFPVTVEYHNEMFTTKMAQAAMLERGEKKVSSIDDAESAKILLQSWLDKKPQI